MQPNRRFANPFYALLVVVGIAFVLTATAYGVMAFRAANAVTKATPQADHPLMDWMEERGEALLMLELTLLAIGTCGAIATDDYWQRRAAQHHQAAIPVRRESRTEPPCKSNITPPSR